MNEKIYTKAQIQSILDATPADSVTVFVHMLLTTAARLNELRAVCYSDIDFVRHELWIHRSVRKEKNGDCTYEIIIPHIKNKRERYIKLSQETERMLRGLYESDGCPDPDTPVFLINGRLLSRYSISKRMKELTGETATSRLSRRTTAHIVSFSDRCSGISFAATLLGHSNTYVTKKHYAAVQGSDRNRVYSLVL